MKLTADLGRIVVQQPNQHPLRRARQFSDQGRGRLARAVSLAGSWAMRPQTAMAAVFLVMIGTSVLLLRGKSSRAPASAEMTVTEEGTPAPAAPSAGVAADSPLNAVAAEPYPGVRADRPSPAGAGASPTPMFAPPPAADAPLDDNRRSLAKSAPAKLEDGFGAVAANAPLRAAAAMPAVPAAAPAPPPVAAGGGAGAGGGSFATAPEAGSKR